MRTIIQANSKWFVGKLALFVVVSAVTCNTYCHSLASFDKKIYIINVPRLNAAEALNKLALQTGVEMLFPYKVTKTRQANAVVGRYTLKVALMKLLQGSGLSSGLSEDGAINISHEEYGRKNNKERKSMKTKKNILTAMIGFFVGAGNAENMAAQDVPSGYSDALEYALVEIIVTAQKRNQNVQDIPAAISALSAGMLENRGISSPQGLQHIVPGLTLGESTLGGAQVTIRGVGSENISAGGDPGVPLHIDGHYIQLSSYLLKDFFDVERVEVQRGPQGTLYGRNAVGGNINIITKRPSEEFEGKIGLGLGNFSNRTINGVVSGPISERLRGRLALSDQNRDGYVVNLSNGDDLLGENYTTVRGSLEYDLTDNIDIYLNAYHFTDNSISFVNRIVGDYPETGLYASIPYSNPSIDPRKVRSDGPNKGADGAEGASLDFKWDLGSVTFKSLSAYNDGAREVIQDLDGSDLALRNQKSIIDSQTFTQEFQLLSADETDIRWILGAFYFEEKAGYYFDITFPEFDGIFLLNGKNKTESLGLFGQVDYALTDTLELTAGLRYTHDKKEMDRSLYMEFAGVIYADDQPPSMEDSWAQMSGKLGLSYRVNDDVLLYASYSLGFKGGGFNASTLTEPAYDPELLDAYELGMKGQFLDDHLQLNMSTFYYDYTDKVESKIDVFPGSVVATSIFTNAGSATVVGIEFEAQAYLTESLRIDASVSYQKSEYKEFDSQDPQFSSLGVQDLSGNSLPRSPEKKLHVGAEYEWNLSGDSGSLTARVDYSWVDEQYFRAFNLDTDKSDSYHRTNAQLRWQSGDASWAANLYVHNIEDDDVLSNLGVASESLGFAHYGSYLSPRTYGVQLSYDF